MENTGALLQNYGFLLGLTDMLDLTGASNRSGPQILAWTVGDDCWRDGGDGPAACGGAGPRARRSSSNLSSRWTNTMGPRQKRKELT
jgi:hypothetical protein